MAVSTGQEDSARYNKKWLYLQAKKLEFWSTMWVVMHVMEN